MFHECFPHQQLWPAYKANILIINYVVYTEKKLTAENRDLISLPGK